MLPIEASIALIFIGIMFWAFIHVCRNKRFKRLKAWAPLLIQAATVIIVLTFPFTAVVVKLDFKLHLEERQEVVSKVIKGELAPYSSDRCSRIDLPEKYHHLTRGGFIKVQKQNGTVYVFFYTFRGILDNFSGFMYRSDDTYPKIGDCGADIKESEKLKKTGTGSLHIEFS